MVVEYKICMALFLPQIGPVLREVSEEYYSLPSSLEGVEGRVTLVEKLESPRSVLHTKVAVLK